MILIVIVGPGGAQNWTRLDHIYWTGPDSILVEVYESWPKP